MYITQIHSYLFVLGDILMKPIIAHAGKDITHWFDPDTKDVSYNRLYAHFLPVPTYLWGGRGWALLTLLPCNALLSLTLVSCEST